MSTESGGGCAIDGYRSTSPTAKQPLSTRASLRSSISSFDPVSGDGQQQQTDRRQQSTPRQPNRRARTLATLPISAMAPPNLTHATSLGSYMQCCWRTCERRGTLSVGCCGCGCKRTREQRNRSVIASSSALQSAAAHTAALRVTLLVRWDALMDAASNSVRSFCSDLLQSAGLAPSGSDGMQRIHSFIRRSMKPSALHSEPPLIHSVHTMWVQLGMFGSF